MRDVSVDAEAAREMVDRTRQMGVPVIADEQEAIVGFDMPRLQRMAARHRRGGGLGLKVADARDAPGALVGGVREDSPGARAGVEVGDVIVELFFGGGGGGVFVLLFYFSLYPPARPADEYDRAPQRRAADAHPALRTFLPLAGTQGESLRGGANVRPCKTFSPACTFRPSQTIYLARRTVW